MEQLLNSMINSNSFLALSGMQKMFQRIKAIWLEHIYFLVVWLLLVDFLVFVQTINSFLYQGVGGKKKKKKKRAFFKKNFFFWLR